MGLRLFFAIVLLLQGCGSRNHRSSPKPATAAPRPFSDGPRTDPWAELRQPSPEDAYSDKQWYARQQQRRQDEQAMRDKEEAEEIERQRVRREAAEAEEEKQRVLIAEKAKKRGFSQVNLDHGLVGVIEMIRDGDLKLEVAKKMAIQLGDNDHRLVAIQVVDQNNVLFSHDDVTVWLKNYGRRPGSNTWLEGAKLIASELRFFSIKGIKPYRTITGGVRQAVIIEAAF